MGWSSGSQRKTIFFNSTYYNFFLKEQEFRHFLVIWFYFILQLSYNFSWLNLIFHEFQERIHDIWLNQVRVFKFTFWVHCLPIESHFILWSSRVVATPSTGSIFLFYIWWLKSLKKLFNVYLLLRERERQSPSGRWAQRER